MELINIGYRILDNHCDDGIIRCPAGIEHVQIGRTVCYIAYSTKITYSGYTINRV